MSGALDVLGFLEIDTRDIDTRPKGPRGGDLNDPRQYADARRAHFNGAIDPETGLPGMHALEAPNFRDTAIPGRIKEPWWAPMAMFMLLAGCTNDQIAEKAQVTRATVAQIRAQRWFQEKLATVSHENGQATMGLIQAEAVASVEKLVYLRDHAESERVQAQCALNLLEHAKGKPIATITTTNTTRLYRTPEEEYADIQTQLRNIRATTPKTLEALPEVSTQPPTT